MRKTYKRNYPISLLKNTWQLKISNAQTLKECAMQSFTGGYGTHGNVKTPPHGSQMLSFVGCYAGTVQPYSYITPNELDMLSLTFGLKSDLMLSCYESL